MANEFLVRLMGQHLNAELPRFLTSRRVSKIAAQLIADGWTRPTETVAWMVARPGTRRGWTIAAGVMNDRDAALLVLQGLIDADGPDAGWQIVRVNCEVRA